MRLNVDILFQHLRKRFAVQVFGNHRSDLQLRRPEFYTEREVVFKQNHCYIAMADYLPPVPTAEEGAVVVAVGARPPAVYMTHEILCCMIFETSDQIEVFNTIQRIYDRFEEWELSLFMILDKDGNIQDMIDISFPILENPIVVIDCDYHFIAYSEIIGKAEKGFYYMRDLMHTNPLEVGLDGGIGWNKDFIGKEALWKIKEEGPKQSMVGFTIEEADVRVNGKDLGGPGSHAIKDGEEVGRVSKCNCSYVLDKPIGYIYAETGKAAKGDTITIHGALAVICDTVFV